MCQTNPNQSGPLAVFGLLAVLTVSAMTVLPARQVTAAGTLTPKGSPDQPIRIINHQADIVINNGFARTEVNQTFFNPNRSDLEAIYSFPIPRSASLSEVSIYTGEEEIHGEVLPRAEAETIYQHEKDKGNDAGLAQKDSYQTFDFRVARVPSQAQTRLRFVYYQPVEIDTGVGRYVYPLEDGGTDDVALSFWTANEKVEDVFTADVELKSAFPVVDVRIPGFAAATTTTKIAEGHYKVHLETTDVSLNRDLVFYYRLQDNLPGRVELIPYRADVNKPGTFMLVVTPGLDLQPITGGADYTFVLDVSGSMSGKIGTLANGVSKAIAELRPEDRFRVISFNQNARELTRGWSSATDDNVKKMISKVASLQTNGSTNLYAGIDLALKGLDDDRATSVILVTDGVTNTGVVDPKAFHQLSKQYDVRFFGFLMGNNANWPLMRMICETSGGFYTGVSNMDDILGQILLAKSKITCESLHDAELKITGVKTFDTTNLAVEKVYRGQQLVLFGRYEAGGTATVSLEARLTGEDKTYTTTFDFPETDTNNPELERLSALNRIEATEMAELTGALPSGEVENAIEDLGVAYQLVTDYTSMVVLSDASFDEYGIDRRNKTRLATERTAQAKRRSEPIRNYRVDRPQPMFQHKTPSIQPKGGDGDGGGGGGGGGGAIDPITAAAGLGLAWLAFATRRRQRNAGGDA